MKARLPRSYDQLTPKEKKELYSAVYAAVARNAAVIVTTMAEEMAKKRIAIAVECGLYAGMLTCYDEFGFGSDVSKLGGRKSRLMTFADGYTDWLSWAGDRYDDSIVYGLKEKLRERGVEIETTELPKTMTISELEDAIKAKLVEQGEVK